MFVSHDLNLVRLMSDRVLVMYRGCIVEAGPVDAVFDRPRPPYTRALVSAIPVLDPAYVASRDPGDVVSGGRGARATWSAGGPYVCVLPSSRRSVATLSPQGFRPFAVPEAAPADRLEPRAFGCQHCRPPRQARGRPLHPIDARCRIRNSCRT